MMTAEVLLAAGKLIGVLVLMVGGLLALTAWSRRYLQAGAGGARKTLRVLESTSLGPKKAVTLVKAPGAVLVLGVTHDRITLLDRVEIDDFETLAETFPAGTPPSFQDHLRKLTNGWPRKPLEAAGEMPDGSQP